VEIQHELVISSPRTYISLGFLAGRYLHHCPSLEVLLLQITVQKICLCITSNVHVTILYIFMFCYQLTIVSSALKFTGTVCQFHGFSSRRRLD